MPRRYVILGRILGALILIVAPGLAVADLVIMKDGYTLQGKVKRQTTNFLDPYSGQQIESARLNGFFMVDDEVRRVVFSFRQVQDVDEKEAPRDDDTIKLLRKTIRLDHYRLPPIAAYAGVTPWDAKGERTFSVNGPAGKIDIAQRLTFMTPYYLRIDALRYDWTTMYLTREMDPALVRSLVVQHPDMKLSGDKKDAEKDMVKRYKLTRYLTQAGWYALADAELGEILRVDKGQKEQVETERAKLRKIVAGKVFEEVEQAHKAGRYQFAQDRLAQFPRDGMSEKLLERVDALKNHVEKAAADVAVARQFLKELPLAESDNKDHKLLGEACTVILTEINPDTAHRLEAFVNLARQTAREKEQGRTPTLGPDKLMALAISGWLLGNNSAEDKVEVALKLWRSRQFVLEYQRTPGSGQRQELLQAYEKEGALAFDELAQLIRFLPPPEPENAFQRVMTLQTKPGVSKGGPRSYLVQVPPEYHHARSYPVLFVLHNAGERPQDMMTRMAAASSLGYIVVAPSWEQSVKAKYTYSPEEHAVVLDVLRDLRRRFQIDSDRVFLFGWADGANMAYDVALSHPDQFAGAVVMGGKPKFYVKQYWRNAQYLPLYIVDGDVNGDSPKDNRKQFEQYVPRGYPALYVEYKGRGMEWFDGEFPFIFDWMGRKKRANPYPELGKSGNGGPFGEEFQALRATDDRFYWMSGEDLHKHNINEAGNWKVGITPGSMQARVGEGNQINVTAKAFKKVTLWFGPGMIDHNKPATVYMNLQQRLFNKKIPPSLTTLLEDFYTRGDRQRLYWAKLELSL